MKHYCLLFKLLPECLFERVVIAVLVFWGSSVSALAQADGDQPSPTFAEDSAQANPQGLDQQLVELRAAFDRLRTDYERGIDELQAQMEDLQIQMLRAASDTGPVVAASAPPQVSYNSFNPAISVVANFLARADSRKVFIDESSRIDNRFNLREAELDMRVPVDPFADAVFIMSLESETPGEFEVGIEEGYVNVKKLPFMPSPLGLKFQVGRFRPAFGKLNLLHTHDLPTSLRSLPTEEFLGEEGFIQQGVSADFFVPSPWGVNTSLNARLQVLSGGDLAVSPQSRNKLAYLGNLRWFQALGDAHTAEVGWSSYWHPGNDDGPIVRLHGLDFSYRWKPLRQGQWRSYLLGGEFMFSDRPSAGAKAASGGTNRPFGATVFTQWQLDRRKYVGVRWDYTKALADTDLERRSLTPYISYYFSEFLRLRLNYEHRWSDFLDEDGRNSVFAELNWIFGAHPPEPFWVNK